ncbi:GNAT family N-acetyltransferase [Bacillus sp. FJAT-49711]|nr:GNAT family N-acetyltransferase [Bacillus sp. FJAT-49711]MBS4218806.1 GNAT family N-acetyltransferase [Bacillus sp. FJAT-49711]
MLTPSHILLACFLEKTGVLGEISLRCNMNLDLLITVIDPEHPFIYHDFFTIPIATEVESVIKKSITYMKKYNQIYINEGHILKALLATNTIASYLSEKDKKIIMALGTTSRDMITHLGHYIFPEIKHPPFIRKVKKEDYENLIQFVKMYFSEGWAQTIEKGLCEVNPKIYVAFEEDHTLAGFAAFDIYQNKKCYFGPMGVHTSQRTKGIGYSLLHHCLKDMKEIGYEYAIIGGAGPMEFYEKACNAVVIPMPVEI